MHFQDELAKHIAAATQLSAEKIAAFLEIPPDKKLGDFAFPCFSLGKNPHEAAEQLKEKVQLPPFIAKAAVIGPYLNFFFSLPHLAEATLTEVYQQADFYGKQDLGKGKKIVLEFSSPNIAKPFGIGHLRSTVIGNCLYKVFSFLGYALISVNHLGDWGTQFGKLLVAYKKWGNKAALEREPVQHLLEIYVRFHKEAEQHPELEDEAREAFKKLEEGDKASLELWELFRELSLEEFRRFYRILDVEFDTYHGEAFYNPLLDETVKKMQHKDLATISEGALIVDLQKWNMPPLMLRKSDGTSIYHTRDLAAAFYRLRHYKPIKVIYVVGSEQKLHFQQLFKVLELAGVKKDLFTHVDFGLFRFPEGKMSTRKGNVIFLEEVLDKAVALARKVIEEKNPALQQKEEVAKQVGVGAILFADLSADRVRDVEFSWEKMLSFEGETGPYVQYTHARACSILRKAQKEHNLGVSPLVNFATFNLEEERAVLALLAGFPDVLQKVAETYKPHHLAQHLIALSQAFNEFYHKCPVISEQMHTMKGRLLLVQSVRQVLKNGLQLLGMKAPEEM